MAGLRSFLLEQTAAGGDKAVLQYVTNMLNGNVGFLFNERFINIPAQVRLLLVFIYCNLLDQHSTQPRQIFSDATLRLHN